MVAPLFSHPLVKVSGVCRWPWCHGLSCMVPTRTQAKYDVSCDCAHARSSRLIVFGNLYRLPATVRYDRIVAQR
jgi:hypothetical protein